MFQYIAAGASVVALGLGITAYVQHNKIEKLELDNAVLTSSLSEKDATIDAQNKGIKAMIDEATTQDRAIKAAGERVDALTTNLAAERAKRRAATETDYALPDCRTLLATDLAAQCPAHGERVRRAAQDSR